MKQNQNIKKSKKIIKWSVTNVLILGALASAIFGLVKYSITPTAFKKSYEVQDSYEMQIEVTGENNSRSIDYIADVVYERIDFFNFEGGKVSIIDDSNLLASIPVSSIDTDADDRYSYLSQEDLFREVLNFQNSLTQKRNIEVRYRYDVNTQNKQLFEYDEAGQIKFQPPELELPEEEQPFTNQINSDSPWDIYEIMLFNDANVAYNNGVPFSQLTTATENIWIEMLEMSDVISGLYAPTNPTANEVDLWFGFDEFEWLAETLDPEGFAAAGNDPYVYAFLDSEGNIRSTPIPLAEPYFIGTWTIFDKFNVHNPRKVDVLAELTTAQTRALTNDIKFASSLFELNIVETNLSLTNIQPSSLTWMVISVVIMLLVMGLLMFWWFGLLGLIATSISGTVTLTLLGLISALSIPFSSGTFMAIMIVNIFATIFNYILLTDIKEPLGQKKTYSQKIIGLVRGFNEKSTPVVFALLLFLTFGAILFPALTKLYIYITILGIALSMVYTYIATIPALFGMEAMFKFMDFERVHKWDLVCGSAKPWVLGGFGGIIERGSSKTTIRAFGVVSLLVITTGFMVYGIATAVTGAGVNVEYMYDGYYKYDVVLNWRHEFDPSNDSYSSNNEKTDPFNQKGMIKTVEDDLEKIENILSNNGISTFSDSIVRNDNHSLWRYIDPDGDYEDKYDYSFSYGVSFQSKNIMTLEQYSKINLALKNLGNPLNPDAFNKEGYSLNEAWSLTNFETTNNISNVDNYSVEKNMILEIFGLLAAVGVTIGFILLFFKWDGAFISAIQTLFEILTAFALTVIFWAPFTPTFWIGLFMLLGISLITKVTIMNLARNKMRSMKKIKVDNLFSYYKEVTNKVVYPLIFVIMAILLIATVPLSFLGLYGVGILPIIIFGGPIVFLSNIFVFPLVIAKANEFRRRVKKHRLSLDINESESEDVIDEEYVKGINK